jgi:polyisoprenyl-teichoic acid--peptidoglycan teichoic acid transferase
VDRAGALVEEIPGGGPWGPALEGGDQAAAVTTDALPRPASTSSAPAGAPVRNRRAGGRRAARHRRRRRLRRAAGLLTARRPDRRDERTTGTSPSPAPRRARRSPRTGAAPRGWRPAVAVVLALGLLAVAASVVVPRLLARGGTSADAGAPTVAAAAVTPQTTVLLIRTDEPGGPAAGVTLLAAGDDGTASATFIPSTTLVEIPGVGLDRLALAQQYGGSALTEASVENALGIEVDAAAAVDRAGLGALLQRAGGADLDVPERLVTRAADGSGTVAFEAGPQFLNGVRLAEYWAFEQRGESELDSFPRQQRALDALLRALADEAVRAAVLGASPELQADVPVTDLEPVLARLADAALRGVLAYQLLPVAPFGAADEALGTSYQIAEDEAAALVARHLAGSVPAEGDRTTLAVQVLNGVGVPGIGQAVDRALDGLPVRIVRTDNARSFDFPETQVLVYDEDPATVAAARQVQQALGVGTVLVSRQPQSVVDLTVVVGADFAGAAPAAAPGP